MLVCVHMVKGAHFVRTVGDLASANTASGRVRARTAVVERSPSTVGNEPGAMIVGKQPLVFVCMEVVGFCVKSVGGALSVSMVRRSIFARTATGRASVSTASASIPARIAWGRRSASTVSARGIAILAGPVYAVRTAQTRRLARSALPPLLLESGRER